jgi:Zn-dependent protease with chaperone function
VIGWYLLGFAVAVTAAAVRCLPHAGWVYRAPRLGIAAWNAALVSVSLAIAAALASMLVPMGHSRPAVCTAFVWCVQALRGGYGTAARLVADLLVAVVAVVALRAAVAVARGMRAAAIRRRAHHDLLSVAGRRVPDLDATVIDHPQPAAYLLGGVRRRVVVTSGALEQLSESQLKAVVAHERAHAAGRHQILLDAARLLAQAFPRLALFAVARRQVGRLVELRADEVAATGHPRIDLARALVTLATPVGAGSAVPAGAVAASGGDATERLHRILTPPAPLPPVARLTVGLAAVVLPAVPLALLAVGQIWPAVTGCPWLG